MPMGIKLQKLIVAFVAGLIAVGSGIALTHVGRAPDRTAAEVSDATPTIGEGRNLTREILRSRREHGEAMAEVHPDPSLGERERIVTKEPEPVAKETTKEAIAAIHSAATAAQAHISHRHRDEGRRPSGNTRISSPRSTIPGAQPGWANSAAPPSGRSPCRSP